MQEIEASQRGDAEQDQYWHAAEQQGWEGNSKVEAQQPGDYGRGRNQQKMEQRDGPKPLPDKHGRGVAKFF
jgi:hypothetical protein